MKKHINNILIILFLSLLVVGCFQTTGTITGRVTDSDDNPISGAIVVVQPEGYAETTDENGEYTIENLSLGDYTVTAISGDISNSKEITIADESFGCTPPEIKVDDIQLDTSEPADGTTTYTLTTNVNPVGSGTVTLDPSGGSYQAGTEVTLTAIQNSGYIFSNWSGGATGTSNPKTVTVSTNITVTANFSSQPETYPPFEFEVDGQGWVPIPVFGIAACARTTDIAKNGTGSLKLYCDLDGAETTGKRQGHVRSTLDSVVDFTGLTLSGWVFLPTGSEIDGGTNRMTLFVQDESWQWGSTPNVAISTWTGIMENQWCEISGTPTGAADITKIKHVGLQIGMSTTTADTYTGAIYLDAVDWQ